MLNITTINTKETALQLTEMFNKGTLIPVSKDIWTPFRPNLNKVKDKTLFGISTVCGGGKTQLLIHKILPQLIQNQYEHCKLDGPILVASKTLDLSHQTGNEFIQTYGDMCEGLGKPAIILDGKNCPNVRGALKEMIIDDGFEGIVFISHASLFNLAPKVLEECTVFIDEIPQQLVSYVQLPITNIESDLTRWLSNGEEGWLNYIETNHRYKNNKLNKVMIKEDKYYELQKEILEIKMGGKPLTPAMMEMMEMVYQGFDPVYVTELDGLIAKEDVVMDMDLDENTVQDFMVQDGDKTTFFQTISTKNLYNVVAYPKKTFILAANIIDTLAGFVAVDRFKMDIQMIHQEDLPQKHKTPLVITPLLKQGTYTSGMKGGDAEGVIQGYNGKQTVYQLANTFVKDTLGKGGLLQYDDAGAIKGQVDGHILFKNNKDATPTYILKSNHYLSSGTQVHGMNNMMSWTKAAFLGSLIPTPYEMNALGFYAEDLGLDKDTIKLKAKTERSYEAAYQCIARLAFRNQNFGGMCQAIVPDMGYVGYFKNWWEEGKLIIQDHNSFISLKKDTSTKTEAHKVEVVLKIEAFMADNKAKKKAFTQAKKTNPDLVPEHLDQKGMFNWVKENFNLSKATYQEWKKECHNELVKAGYAKPKSPLMPVQE